MPPSAKNEALQIVQVLAELQRAKRASKAPWVRRFGNPSQAICDVIAGACGKKF